MNDAQLLEQLSLTDAYAPDTGMPSGARTPDATFSEIERRIDLQTQERPTRTPPERPRRTGLLVAAAAFVTVLIVGLALIVSLGTGPDDEPATSLPPTTTTTAAPTTSAAPTTEAPPTTPTTAAPELDPAALAYFEQVVADLNDGDATAAAAELLEAETLIGPVNEADDRLLVASWFALWAELESEATLEDCSTNSSGVTRCVIAHTSLHQPFYPDRERVIFEAKMTDDVAIEWMRVGRDATSPTLAIWLDFLEWLYDRDAEAHNMVFFVLDAERAAQIHREQVPIWLAEQNGDSPEG